MIKSCHLLTLPSELERELSHELFYGLLTFPTETAIETCNKSCHGFIGRSCLLQIVAAFVFATFVTTKCIGGCFFQPFVIKQHVPDCFFVHQIFPSEWIDFLMRLFQYLGDVFSRLKSLQEFGIVFEIVIEGACSVNINLLKICVVWFTDNSSLPPF